MNRRAVLAALLASGAASSLPAARPRAIDGGSAVFVAWAKSVARGADTAHAAAIAPLIAGDARVVALGEPTHGAAEPLLLRNALIAELVTRHGVMSVALETGSTGARVLDAYVTGGAGAGGAERLARDHLSWGFGAFAANAALLRWLRDHNAAGGRVRFFGIDVPGGDEKGGMSFASRVLDAPLALLTRAEDRRARALGERLALLAPALDQAKYAHLTATERKALSSAVFELGRTLATMTGEPVALNDARHDADMAALLLRMSAVWPHTAGPGPVPPGFFRVTNVREQAMADNVLRIAKYHPGRVLVFAHDGHVMNAPVAGGAWDALTEAPLPMGMRLRRALGRNYRITGMTAVQNAPPLPTGGEEVWTASSPPSVLLRSCSTLATRRPAGWTRRKRCAPISRWKVA